MADEKDNPATDATADDPKERYRQALERKKAQGGHQGHGQASSGGPTKGSSAKAGGKREFRRKSG
jgi:membrane-associated protein